MTRQLDLEPISVNFGEEFQPFLGMNKLRPGENLNVTGQSRVFNLREIGQGTVYLANCLSVEHSIEGNVLYTPKNKSQLVPIKRYFRNHLNRLVVDIYFFSPHLRVQPDITCTLRAGEIKLTAENTNSDCDMRDSALFFLFASSDKSKDQNLFVPPKLSFLKDLSFRFEPK